MATNATVVLDLKDCTKGTCPASDAFYAYTPALPENSFFILLFSISLTLFSYQAYKKRTWLFHSGVFLGCLAEIIGYVGRVQSHFNIFDMNAFLAQIICLTIAPAFFSASIYICLSRIVSTFGNAEIAMMSSRWYSIIFIVGDFLSLFFQSVGGGMASVASQSNQNMNNGNHIMLIGLTLQVFFLTLFIILAAEFAVRVFRNVSTVSNIGKEVLGTKDFKIFVWGLALATLCIYIRSVYRVIELAQGWKGYLASIQVYFIVFEGLMIAIATFAMNFAHPGYRFSQGYFSKANGGSTANDEKTVEDV